MESSPFAVSQKLLLLRPPIHRKWHNSVAPSALQFWGANAFWNNFCKMLNLKGPRRQPGGLLLCTFPGINCPLGIYSSYFIILFSGLGKTSLSLFRQLGHCTDPVNLGGNILLSLIAKPPQNCWAQKRSYCNLVWHDLPTVGSMAACLPGLWPQGDLGIWSSCHTPEAASWFQYQPSSPAEFKA